MNTKILICLCFFCSFRLSATPELFLKAGFGVGGQIASLQNNGSATLELGLSIPVLQRGWGSLSILGVGIDQSSTFYSSKNEHKTLLRTHIESWGTGIDYKYPVSEIISLGLGVLYGQGQGYMTLNDSQADNTKRSEGLRLSHSFWRPSFSIETRLSSSIKLLASVRQMISSLEMPHSHRLNERRKVDKGIELSTSEGDRDLWPAQAKLNQTEVMIGLGASI